MVRPVGAGSEQKCTAIFTAVLMLKIQMCLSVFTAIYTHILTRPLMAAAAGTVTLLTVLYTLLLIAVVLMAFQQYALASCVLQLFGFSLGWFSNPSTASLLFVFFSSYVLLAAPDCACRLCQRAQKRFASPFSRTIFMEVACLHGASIRWALCSLFTVAHLRYLHVNSLRVAVCLVVYVYACMHVCIVEDMHVH